MASPLVSTGDFRVWLGLEDPGEDLLLELLLDEVTGMLLAECGRGDRPFQPAQAGRVEVHDALPSCRLYLAFPVASLTSVVLGANPSAPDETLAVNDLDVLSWAAGERRLERVDGRWFAPCVGWGYRRPRYVHVTYDAQADLPTDASLAVMRVAAAIYRQRGQEGSTTDRVGGFAGDVAPVAETDPVWQAAVNAHRDVSFR